MKRIFFFFFLFSFFFSCSERIEKPKDLIPEAEMVQILSEVFIYQQSSYSIEKNLDSINHAMMNLNIFEKHKISKEQFKNSYQYYIANPDDYENILLGIEELYKSKLPEEEGRLIQEAPELE